MKTIMPILISTLVFCFIVFMFQDLETAVFAISESEPLKPLIIQLPKLLLIITGCVPVFSLFGEGK